MLPYILALVVAVGSLILYLSAFFFPETHRKGDIVFSGVGLFYALVLWVCANRFTGAALLGQTASVALLTWLGWQTLTLRRELVPSDRRTGWGPKTIQQGVGRLIGGLMKLPGDLVGLFSQSKAVPVAPPPSVPAAPETLTEIPTGSAEVTVEAADTAGIVEAAIAPEPATPDLPTTIVDTPAPSPEVIEPQAPVTGVVDEPAAPTPIAPHVDQKVAPEPELVETEALTAAGSPDTETGQEADTREAEETGDVWTEADQGTAESPPEAPTKPQRENLLTVLKDALVALSPFKRRPSRPMITLNRPEVGEATSALPRVESQVESESEAEALGPVAETEIAAEAPPGMEASPAAAGEGIPTVEPDQSAVDDWKAEASPAVAHTTDALSDALSEEGLADAAERVSNEADAARLELPEELEASGETDRESDGAAAIAVSAEVEVAQSDLDVIDEPVPEAAIEIEASPVSETEDDLAGEVTSAPQRDRDHESKPKTSP
ncbi:Ycf66 family protein [Trichothermofontia sichuanensis B231]|uniref:Ycf66 family protein n=1 Tax=Trichothermofontia sichuanensis TaxID=3045816 RepID=UPI00224656F5|nr:Ycf66 family protein [Trichothermofontia sichuanensis]UZQ55948.1 Ycf66 family protein [Trichothermofontia sichuanensis B231]